MIFYHESPLPNRGGGFCFFDKSRSFQWFHQEMHQNTPQKKCKKRGLPHYLMRQPPLYCGFRGNLTQTQAPARPSPGRFFQFPRLLVCVSKPNSLCFRGVLRKPKRPPGRRPAVFSKSPGPWFAYQNRIHWVSGEPYANPSARPAVARLARVKTPK